MHQPNYFTHLTEIINQCRESSQTIYWHNRDTIIDYASAIAQEAYILGTLLKAECKPERIALIAEMNRDFIIRFFACQYAGKVPVLLPTPTFQNSRWYDETSSMLRTSHCQYIWLDKNNTLLTECPNHALQFLSVITLQASDYKMMPISQTISHQEKTTLNPIAYIQFTSGSSGPPKGICITQTAVLANIQEILTDGLALQPADKAISWLPLYHDMGLVGFFLAPFTAQCELHYLATRQFIRNPMHWLDLISQYQLTVSYAPNFAYERLSHISADKIPNDLDLKSWRIAGTGAETIKSSTLHDFTMRFTKHGFQKESFWPSYGMAEATLAISIRDENTPLLIHDNNVSCGKALPSMTIKVLSVNDTHKNNPIDADTDATKHNIGEILVKGKSIAQYYADGSLIPKTDQGYFKTGDLGYIYQNQLFVIGRSKECIIINGRNIWPETIEQDLKSILKDNQLKYPFIITTYSKKGQESLAFIVAKSTWTQEEIDLVTALVQQSLMQQYGVSADYFFINQKSDLKTTSGKAARIALQVSLESNTLTYQQAIIKKA